MYTDRDVYYDQWCKVNTVKKGVCNAALKHVRLRCLNNTGNQGYTSHPHLFFNNHTVLY